MQVTVSRVSPVEVEVRVLLPKERVTSALTKAYSALSKSAQIRGFRKGHVPMPLIKQYYGGRVMAQVWEQLVDESLPQALKGENLEPVVQPDVKPEKMPEENSDLTYTAKLEVRPHVENIVLDGITVSRKVYSVSDADVAHQIEHMRESYGTLRTPEPARAIKAGDVVTLSYDVMLDGAVRDDMRVKDRSVEVGKGRMLPEIDAALTGMNAGEQRDVSVKFSDTHMREEVRGKSALLKLSVSEIREKVLPEVDDEFAKDVGSDSLAALRAKIRADIEREATETMESQVREDAMTAMVEKNSIAVPPSLVNNTVAMIAREVAQELRFRGEPMDPEKVINTAKERAEVRVRAGLLLGELAKRHGLTVTEDDINARIDEMAKATGKAVAKLRAEHRDANKREALANAVLEDKVFTLLISKIKVTDVPADKPLHTHEH